MELERPMPSRVQLTAKDPSGERPSKSVMIYDTTPDAVIQEFAKFLESRKAENPQPVS